MNESTYIMPGDYGARAPARRREISKDHNDGRKAHSALKAGEINSLLQTWRPKPDGYRSWCGFCWHDRE